jgi:hypothetical protein
MKRLRQHCHEYLECDSPHSAIVEATVKVEVEVKVSVLKVFSCLSLSSLVYGCLRLPTMSAIFFLC